MLQSLPSVLGIFTRTVRGAVCPVAEYATPALHTDTAVREENKPYDLILPDRKIPEMNGYGAIRALQASGGLSTQTTSTIAMTANAFADDAGEVIDSCMGAHIAKPVQVDTPISTIRQVLGSWTAAKNPQLM